MKPLIASLGLAVGLATVLTTWPVQADAKRIGGGKAVGMQRQSTPAPGQAQPSAAPNQTPAQAPAQAAAAKPGTPAAAAAPAPKRSWMGPLAGLAAGLGLAALFSHFGMGEALGSLVSTLLIVALVAVVGLWLFRRFFAKNNAPALRPAFAGAGGAPGAFGHAGPSPAFGGNTNASRSFPAVGQGPAAPPQAFQADGLDALNAGQGAGMATAGGSSQALNPDAHAAAALDPAAAEALARVAHTLFIRLQAANDAGDVDDLRKFTTPELFAALRVDLLERGATAQQTDVLQLAAQVVSAAEEDAQQVVSVRFDGLIREAAEAPAAGFAEVWHLVRPASGQGDWRIAGITPVA